MQKNYLFFNTNYILSNWSTCPQRSGDVIDVMMIWWPKTSVYTTVIVQLAFIVAVTL